MEISLFIGLCFLIIVLCGILAFFCLVLGLEYEDEVQLVGIIALGFAIAAVILLLCATAGMDQSKKKDPIETTIEVVEAYTPSNETFTCHQLIDKGVFQIKTQDWTLEIPDEEIEFCEGKHKVELCKDTETYKFFFLYDTTEKTYYKVYTPKEGD